MRLRRPIYSISIAVSLIALSASVVYAANPHFRSVSAELGSPKLIISAVEVGLGSGTTVTYEASASVTTTAQCVNGGDQNPSASNKVSSGEVDASATAVASPKPLLAPRISAHGWRLSVVSGIARV